MSIPSFLEEAGWQFHWRVTESAGLLIYLAGFHGRRVLWDASLPYVTVDHQKAEVSPEDALELHGPWWGALGARTLDGPVRLTRFRTGVELAADFDLGVYRYTQLWRFHQNGRLDPWLTLHGRGVNDSHTYHPHWRFDFDLAYRAQSDGAEEDAIEYWDEGRWQRIVEEGWLPYTGETAPDGFVWRQIDFGTGAAVNIKPHHWEDAEVFAIRYHAAEWPPFTPRGALGDQEFPAGYLGGEPIEGHDVALWYSAHVHFDPSFPMTAGPWIQLTGL